ncbi:hypothetical protein [Prescottella equi]|uniref:hypothetical protein n=1 Tax=Rhodococcus hoagii TaxID=43767 RepID=UPI00384D28AE
MDAVTGLLAHRAGEILTATLTCPCGEDFTARRRVVRDTRNPALNTCIDLDFEASRRFRREHRSHARSESSTTQTTAHPPTEENSA